MTMTGRYQGGERSDSNARGGFERFPGGLS